MAEMTINYGGVDITFMGTPEELAVTARKLSEDKPAEIEGPVRVGDTIEITETTNPGLRVGRQFEVEGVTSEGYPRSGIYAFHKSKYRIVARKEETPQPAKPSVKVGDYIVFSARNEYITEGKIYRVERVKDDGRFCVVDDEDDENFDKLPKEYRIITDARELAFAKAGRKLDEFKAGDIVRVIDVLGTEYLTMGQLTEVVRPDGTGRPRVSTDKGGPRWAEVELIAPAEARVDRQ